MMIDCGDMTVPPEWHVTERTAPGFSRVYFIRGGEVVYADEHCRKRLKRDTIYIFPSAAPFRIQHDPAHPLRCTYLHLDVFPILVRELVELPVEPDGFLDRLFGTFAVSVRRESQRVVAALSEGFEHYCREKGFLASPVMEISVPLLYIAEHIGQGAISVEELSGLMGYNAQYFIRLFRRSVGMTPHQYITNYRMSESVKLLRQEEYTVAQVAELVGYPDSKAFGRAFKDKYGITATQFRQLDMPLP